MGDDFKIITDWWQNCRRFDLNFLLIPLIFTWKSFYCNMKIFTEKKTIKSWHVICDCLIVSSLQGQNVCLLFSLNNPNAANRAIFFFFVYVVNTETLKMYQMHKAKWFKQNNFGGELLKIIMEKTYHSLLKLAGYLILHRRNYCILFIIVW